MEQILLQQLNKKGLSFSNRIVMAPMNRRRAVNGIPDESMRIYYEQRVDAGLIITDNTAIAPNAIGYLNTPGIYNEAQQEGWMRIVDTVHRHNGKIFIQLVHTGRIGHPLNHEGRLPLVGVSDIAANESVRTPGDTYLPMPRPEVLSTKQVKALVRLHVESAVKAIELGFDGVEIHAAHGFLAEQFLHPEINNREDEYGGNMENRSRFLLEIIEQASSAIGKERIGVRLSPFAVVNDLPLYEEELMTHQYLLDALQRLDILFVHLSNQVSNGKSTIPLPYLRDVRERFQNLVLFTGGNSITSATKLLEDGLIDLAGFGKPFIANPDLVKRVRYGYPFATGDEATFYHGGDKGYIDYGAFSS